MGVSEHYRGIGSVSVEVEEIHDGEPPVVRRFEFAAESLFIAVADRRKDEAWGAPSINIRVLVPNEEMGEGEEGQTQS